MRPTFSSHSFYGYPTIDFSLSEKVWNELKDIQDRRGKQPIGKRLMLEAWIKMGSRSRESLESSAIESRSMNSIV